jgi:hypothetical protein
MSAVLDSLFAPGLGTLQSRGHAVIAQHVVLCTNGFVDHTVQTPAGDPIRLAGDQRITGRAFHDSRYDPDALFPAQLLTTMDDQVQPFAQPSRPAGLPYDSNGTG